MSAMSELERTWRDVKAAQAEMLAAKDAEHRTNIDAIRDAKDADLRTLRAAKDAEIAALREVVKQARVYVRSDQEWLREELDAALEMSGGVKCSHCATIRESERAACEASAAEVAKEDYGDQDPDYMDGRTSAAADIADALAARKGKGEGK